MLHSQWIECLIAYQYSTQMEKCTSKLLELVAIEWELLFNQSSASSRHIKATQRNVETNRALIHIP
jgi:hypothetical protein